MNDPKVILFDLGAVLIDFAGLDAVRKVMADDPGPDRIREKWITSPALSAFERGRVSPEEFCARFVEEWRLDMNPVDFSRVFCSWIVGAMPGAQALLRELRPHFRLACLSNTSALHWDRMLVDCGLGPLLEKHYASHLSGVLKPDPAAFAMVCDDLGCEPGEVMFFDDGDENVRGARAFGLSAHKVNSPAEIRATLTDLGHLR